MNYVKPILTAGVLAATLASAEAQVIIAAWDFAGLPATTTTTATPATIAATVGTGSLDVSAFGLGSPQGTSPERTAFAGSTLNAFAGGDATAGMALALANSSANGESIVFSLDMSGYSDLTLSFATRGTSTGFNTHAWAYSTDGVSYTSLVGNNTAVTATSFTTKSVDFSSFDTLNSDPSIFIRLTVSGASSSSGNNRLDNVVFSATLAPVPEPETYALIAGVGLVGFGLWRRIRR